MSKDKDKIIYDTINYLKFHSGYYDFNIYKNEVKQNDSSADKIKKDNSAYSLTEEKVITDNESIIEKGILVKETAADSMIPLLKESWMECETMESFAEDIKNCPKCKLLSSRRKQVVFGTGNPSAEVVVVGEAPGADEDEQGKPFVGRAGKLLTDILKAINFTRDEVFICNILKCRPPDNRNPQPDEIANCEPYLFKQLDMIKPKLILAVGTFAAQTLLNSKEPLGRLRGKFHSYKGIKMMVTYHPAALLRNPNWKRPTWEDVQLFRKEYDKIVNNES